MKKQNKKGFTIVELIIVIAVIAILAAILVPVISNLINRAHVTKDTQLVRNLNTSLAMDTVQKHETMQSALDAVAKNGFDVAKINSAALDNMILWDSENDVFCYRMVDENNNVSISYIPNSIEAGKELDVNDYRLWIISDTVDETFSTYYTGNATTINTSKGFDAGNCTTIETINYTNSTAAQDVVIRTNSAATTLTIDDESTGTIYHYGSAGALNIIQCHTASYHENGKVGFAEIAKGRIVLEKGADVEEIHINKKTDASFDTVVIANNGGADELPDRITRDAVTVSEETLVVKVESNGSSENVYVYADGATGTKGSTQKITEGENKQNENVNSALGQLVLDNGTTADKAQTPEEKADAKDAAASEAVSADFEQDPANANYVARIGQTGYLTLDAAINAAKTSENPATVSLLKDIQTTSSFSITRSMTIKGSNHTITAAGTGSGYLFTVQDDNSTPSNMTFNISDLKLLVTGRQCVVLVNNANDDFSHTFNISNTDITTDGEAVYSNGTSISNVTNCSIRHEGTYATGKEPVYYTALIVGYKGTLNATGCTITSFGNGVGAFPSGGTINLNDCTVLASDDYVSENTGYSIYVWHKQDGFDNGAYKDYVGDSIINVYSGTYNGPLRYRFEPVANPNPSITYYNAQLNIYAGAFSNDPSEYVQSGHSAQQNQDGTWTVK